MTYLIVPITAGTFEQAKADILRAKAAGADMVELRLDHMANLTANDFAVLQRIATIPLPLLLTARSRDEGGVWDLNDERRLEWLGAIAPYGNLCDVELATLERMPGAETTLSRAIDRLARRKRLPAMILSAHYLTGRPHDLLRIVERLVWHPSGAVPKIVFQAQHISQSFELFDVMRAAHEHGRSIIAIAMGEAGLITRILAKKFGAFGTFASLEAGKESAPGQITIDEMKNLYHWDAMNKDTAVYGVIGNPVGHSMSPAIHNAAFERCGVNAVYVPLLIEATYEHFEDFLREALERPWFDLGGVSVTIPHKANALRFARMREGTIEPLAARIGAVNTLTFKSGKVAAHNTDYAGALDALTGTLGCSRQDLRGMEVAVLGAGGVARAIVAGLCDCGCRVTIYNRTAERARQLADEFGCTAAPNEERVRAGAKIVVNGTSIGMHPNVDETPLPADRLQPGMTVFDTVYNPIETKLLREARQVGCRTVDGVTMFVNQAAAQFERWTGQSAPRDLMREVVIRRLATK